MGCFNRRNRSFGECNSTDQGLINPKPQILTSACSQYSFGFVIPGNQGKLWVLSSKVWCS